MPISRSVWTWGVYAQALLLLLACGDSPRAPASDSARTARTAPALTIPPPSATPVRSPDSYRVKFATTKGDFVVSVNRALAPRGADRFYELVTIGYFSQVRFYRIVPGFIVQFGIHGDPAVNTMWNAATIPDEPMRTSNTRGTVAFAAAGPNSRTTELFVSTGNNTRKLDGQRLFAPIGKVTSGLDIVETLNSEYGEQPNFARIVRQGNAFLQRWYPALDYITSATIER